MSKSFQLLQIALWLKKLIKNNENNRQFSFKNEQAYK